MNKNQKTKEKVCVFYASDYHFEMISLPYIDKRMKEQDEVVILTENNLEETMKTLLSKTNLEENKKKDILKLNWKNNDSEKFKKIENKIKEAKNTIIFIKGKENYIKYANKNIDEYMPANAKIKIIDCYDIEEVGENLEAVMKQYQKILKTTGEQEIEKI